MTVDLETELNSLYQAPLADFVTQRNQLARTLKQAGAKADAERVTKLARPTPVAWVMNQLHFRQGDAMNALVDSGAALKRAQEALVSASEFAECKNAHAQALRIATEAAIGIAEGAGMALNAGLRRRVELGLAVMSAAEGTEHAAPGRMSVEPQPSGFDAFAGAELPEKPASGASASAPSNHAAREAARDAFAAIEKELERLETEARAAQERYEHAAREAAEIDARAAAAHRARDEARRHAEDAKTQVDEVRGQLVRQRKALGEG